MSYHVLDVLKGQQAQAAQTKKPLEIFLPKKVQGKLPLNEKKTCNSHLKTRHQMLIKLFRKNQQLY